MRLMNDLLFENLDKSQTEVVSQIGAGNDKNHPILVIADLITLGYIEATSDGGYQMRIFAHIRWCDWCAKNFPDPY